MATITSQDTVARFTAAITGAAFAQADLFTEDAVFDATVPNWRFQVQGGAHVTAQLAHWFTDPGVFEELEITELPGGSLVEFSFAWEEDGVPYACHQLHHLRISDGRISKDTVFCGGRWPAELLAEMDAARHGH